MCRNKCNKLLKFTGFAGPFCLAGLMFLVATPFVPSAAGAWLDINPSTFAPGVAGSFTGTLGVSTVAGNFGPGIGLSPVGAISFGDSTTNNSSPQYSYPGIFTPTIAATDRLGYNKIFGSGVSRITINFVPAVTNPVFHIANLDGCTFNFAPTVGLVGMTLLSGNAGPIPTPDGLALSGTTLSDLNNATVIAFPVTQSPLTAITLPRSAYGSVLLSGSFSTLLIDVTQPPVGGDGGSFTISTVPEPSCLLMAFAALGGLAVIRRRPSDIDSGAAG